MATNSDYFTDALGLIGVLAEGESPSAEQGAKMLKVLNDMMDAFAADGIDLAFNPQSSTTATLDIPEGHKQAVKYLLAVHAAPHFEVPIPDFVATIARSGYDRLLRIAVQANSLPRDFDHLPFRRGRHSILNG
jgi:hypothetical protein